MFSFSWNEVRVFELRLCMILVELQCFFQLHVQEISHGLGKIMIYPGLLSSFFLLITDDIFLSQ